ncbi:MAG: VCBS repeat-containing protein [Ignavibacterium sp.]|nr:VCBS repeat-containing protein [Ignavibacterium sp.]
MKKLLSEEKPVLKTVYRISKILIFVLLFSHISFPQIPINGFCKIDKFSVPEGFTNLFPLNYNKDSYTDLLLFNPLKKETFVLKGEPNLKFSQPQTISFPFEPKQLKPVYDSLFQISYYAFTSRRSRIFGTLTFNDKGIPEVIHSVKLNYYPDFIDVADLNESGNPSFLISGESFDGISLLILVNNKFEEEKIISGTSFSFAQFVHLNGDDIIDIIAYNLFDKSLYFLINNGRNQFTTSRKLTFIEHINSLHIFDINSDSFKDIIYTYNKGIKVLFGDPLYLFEKSTSVNTNYNVDNISIGDFNHDGLFDLIYFSRKDGIISTLFAKSSYSFHNEVEYLKTSSVSEIIPFFSKFVYGAAYITDDGELGILSEVNSFKDDVVLALSISPEEIILFDYNNNGINDFAIVDNKSKQLRFILRNNFGIPAYYFAIKYFGNNDKLICFDKESNEKIFYLYSINERLIEIFYINFLNFTVKREYLYSEGKIIDIMISTSAEEKPNIHLLYQKDNKLKYGVYTYSSIKYILINYPEISGNWFDAVIVNPHKNIIAHWLGSGNQYQLKFIEFFPKTTKEEIVYSLTTDRKIKTYSTKDLLSEDLFLYSSVAEDYSKLRIILYDQDISVLTKKNIVRNFNKSASPVKISFGYDNLLYFYSEALKSLNRIFINRYYSRVIIKPLAEDINIKKFIVTKLDTRNKHLIYIDSEDNLVKVKKIS